MTYAIVRGGRALVEGLPTAAAVDEALAAARASAPLASLVVQRSDGAYMVHDGPHLVTELEWRASFVARRYNGAPQYPAQPIVGPMPPRRATPRRREAKRVEATSPKYVPPAGVPWSDAQPFSADATRRRA